MTETKNARTLTGEVVSNKMDKTIVVKVKRRVQHPRYGKYITRTTKIHAHDSGNKAQMGDEVTIKESRPYSKQKCWELVEVAQSH